MDALSTLEQAILGFGGRIYHVGGYVRDALLGLKSKDKDIVVTGLTPEQLKHCLGQDIEPVGASFAVYRWRKDDEYIDILLVDDLTADLQRRDFSINAIAMGFTGEFLDPQQGLTDVKNKIIRSHNPHACFTADPLRVMRLIRMVAKLGFKVEETTLIVAKHYVPHLDTIAKERIAAELWTLLGYANPENVLSALRLGRDLGVWQRIIPEFTACVGFEQHNPYHHSTVDEHTFLAIQYAVSRGFSPRSRLALLLHDIAKPQTFSQDAGGMGHFYRHEEEGAKIAEVVLERLCFSHDTVKSIRWMVFNHLRPPKRCSIKTLRRFMHALGEAWEDALDMREADLAAHIVNFDPKTWADALRAKAHTLPEPVAGLTQRDLAVSGVELQVLFGVKGKAIGELKEKALKAIVDGDLSNKREEILNFLSENLT